MWINSQLQSHTRTVRQVNWYKFVIRFLYLTRVKQTNILRYVKRLWWSASCHSRLTQAKAGVSWNTTNKCMSFHVQETFNMQHSKYSETLKWWHVQCIRYWKTSLPTKKYAVHVSAMISNWHWWRDKGHRNCLKVWQCCYVNTRQVETCTLQKARNMYWMYRECVWFLHMV